MKLSLLPPKKSLSKAFLKQRPLRNDIINFRNNLSKLLSKIDEIEREENQKNHVRDFLLNSFYKDSYEVNTKDVKDLVIHTGKSNKSSVGVIIETKRPGNKNEMISKDKLNCKAFQELVLYYMNERIDEKNIDIKYCIVTNIYEWFIFDASYFEKYFYSNKKFVKQYEEWRKGQKVTGDTNLFYNDIARPYIDSIDEEIPVVYFDLRDYISDPKKQDEDKDRNLIALFKLLSPYHLLRVSFADDSNKLDEKFYKELLHIIGLEEIKEGSKHIIRRKEKEKRNAGSLLENAISKLSILDSSDRVSDSSVYGETKEEKNFNIALELCLTWINRILFLKLLEAQLIIYHKGIHTIDKTDYKFLYPGKLKDFDELFSLFHHVLAVPEKEREADVREKFKLVPYLNSTLFEISQLEKETINISNLNDSLSLDLISNSILKDKKNTIKNLTSLEYILRFLDAYDFSSEGTEDVMEENRTLINASVLGKVFEKINGYKDGSIFTPGFITMYMCREAIRLAVTQKFKDKYSWKADTFEDVKNFISDKRGREDVKEFNEVINSIKICDPAVGSGHFLVSSLNEMIAIKSELGIFADEHGARITDYDITVEQDELIITDKKGDIFEYRINPSPSGEGFRVRSETQKLQRTLFHEKQKLIENCLFGVDINPNSVKICMLRLWIELLKNAYYRPPPGPLLKEGEVSSELETLPNIDINIKTGNSLISRFPLDANLSKFGQKEKNIIEQYRNSVREYKNERNRNKKKELEGIIHSLKNEIRTDISIKDPKLLKLNSLKSELDNLENQTGLFEQSKKEQKELAAKKKKLEAELAKLNKEVDDIRSNAIYRNAFEWRFEFPEVLNDEGEFEGFDVVIGNPPYIRVDDINFKVRDYYKLHFTVATGKYDIYYLFYQKSVNFLKSKGILTFITPNRFTSTESGFELRNMLFSRFGSIIINSVSKLGVFDNAKTYPAVVFLFNKNMVLNSLYLKESLSAETISDLTKAEVYSSEELNLLPLRILPLNSNKRIINIFFGLKQKSNRLEDYLLIQEGLRIPKDIESNAGDMHIVKQYQFSKYSDISKGSYVKKSDLFKYVSKESERFKNCEKLKILVAEDALQIEATYDDSFSICQGGIYFGTLVNEAISIKYLLSVLNSKLINKLYSNLFSGMHMGGGYLRYRSTFLYELPILVSDNQNPFIKLVGEILESKKQGKDTTALEEKIDRMVYELYGLTEEEIGIVEGKK